MVRPSLPTFPRQTLEASVHLGHGVGQGPRSAASQPVHSDPSLGTEAAAAKPFARTLRLPASRGTCVVGEERPCSGPPRAVFLALFPLCCWVVAPVSSQILLELPHQQKKTLVTPTSQSRELRCSQEPGSNPCHGPRTAGCLAVSQWQGSPALGLPPQGHGQAPHPGPFCACPLPSLARPARRPSWSSCPSSAPRPTGSLCTSPRAMPPSTAGALRSSTVKVGPGAAQGSQACRAESLGSATTTPMLLTAGSGHGAVDLEPLLARPRSRSPLRLGLPTCTVEMTAVSLCSGCRRDSEMMQGMQSVLLGSWLSNTSYTTSGGNRIRSHAG